MDRLEQIKNEVIQEDGNYRDWESYMDDQPYGASDYMVNEVARRYATEMVRHDRERVADSAKVQYFVVGEKTDVGELTARVDKQSITSLEIELI